MSLVADYLYQRVLLDRVSPFKISTRKSDHIRYAISCRELISKFGMSEPDILNACLEEAEYRKG